MQVIAGLSLKNLKPRVWDPESPHYLPALEAVMVSYAEVHAMPWLRERAMKEGLRKFPSKFGCPDRLVKIVRQFHNRMMVRVIDNRNSSNPFLVMNKIKKDCVLAIKLLCLIWHPHQTQV